MECCAHFKVHQHARQRVWHSGLAILTILRRTVSPLNKVNGAGATVFFLAETACGQPR